jgi:hypothetical protein
MFPKERRKGDCGNAINSSSSGNFRGNYTSGPSGSESLWKNMIGRPDSGKPTVRFDEWELEIDPSGYYASSLLYCINPASIYNLKSSRRSASDLTVQSRIK